MWTRALDSASTSDAEREALLPPEELYRLHSERVYRRCLALTQDPAMAEDVMQDVFVRLHEKGHTIADPRALPAWLLRVADRLCLDRLRHDRSFRRRIRDAFLSAPAPPAEPPGGFDPERLLEEVRGSLSDLPVRERAVVIMKYVEGERQTVIARRLSCSEGQVSKILTQAIRRLRARGWECEHG
jgi:RNA polymerase sigma-70 factor (ECF subfamily)